MKRYLSRLTLSQKMTFISLLPLVLLAYLSYQVYQEKGQKVELLSSFVKGIQRSANLNSLIQTLQEERRFSFDYALTGAGLDSARVIRHKTDSIILRLERDQKRVLLNFRAYTFLDQIDSVRQLIDSSATDQNFVMHYYSTLIFRLNTLNAVPQGTFVYLRPIYGDLMAQKLLSEMITELGIIRSNIYNVLVTKKYATETLFGMTGLYDVYKSHEKEFFIKASDSAIARYNQLRQGLVLGRMLGYIDRRFSSLTFDSSYSAKAWWRISGAGIASLTALQQQSWNEVEQTTSTMLSREKQVRDRTLLLLLLAYFIVVFITILIIRTITAKLNELGKAALDISRGESPAQPITQPTTDVVGSLAKCISKIDENHRLLAEAALAIGHGNFEVDIEVRSEKDVLGNAIALMKDNLRSLAAALGKKVEETKEMNEQLRELSAHLQHIREEERKHIAREMHDELGQLLTGFKIETTQLVNQLEGKDNEFARQRLRAMTGLIDESMVFVRKLAAELRPSLLDDLGLVAALEWHSEEFSKRHNIQVNLKVPGEPVELGPTQATGLFRIFQESLTNVARHSGASRVEAELSMRPGKICLHVEDNGKGFDTSTGKKTLGLLGMRERATMIGGTLNIHSNPGTGTQVTIEITV